jgi:hypothetical protein
VSELESQKVRQPVSDLWSSSGLCVCSTFSAAYFDNPDSSTTGSCCTRLYGYSPSSRACAWSAIGSLFLLLRGYLFVSTLESSKRFITRRSRHEQKRATRGKIMTPPGRPWPAKTDTSGILPRQFESHFMDHLPLLRASRSPEPVEARLGVSAPPLISIDVTSSDHS